MLRMLVMSFSLYLAPEGLPMLLALLGPLTFLAAKQLFGFAPHSALLASPLSMLCLFMSFSLPSVMFATSWMRQTEASVELWFESCIAAGMELEEIALVTGQKGATAICDYLGLETHSGKVQFANEKRTRR